jgi:hypothetical protein
MANKPRILIYQLALMIIKDEPMQTVLVVILCLIFSNIPNLDNPSAQYYIGKPFAA